MPGTLFVVATPIGNLEDITARALRVLREVALIAAEDTRRTAHLLTRYAITTPTTSLHEHNETQKTSGLIGRLTSGDSIALVSDAGTPMISDPGEHLIRAAIEAGVRIETIPGPSAILAALAVSGFSTQPFVFLGFPPVRSKDRARWLTELGALSVTAIFFEAPHRIHRTLDEIHSAFGDIPVMIGRELTKAHESLVRGPISDVLRDPHLATGELTVVADLGHKPDLSPRVEASDATIAAELGQLTKEQQITKREAIQKLAVKHRRRPNEIYSAVERAKKLVK
jgi:16S rRNA (cytidine1402-2'-O)-methyltransferase